MKTKHSTLAELLTGFKDEHLKPVTGKSGHHRSSRIIAAFIDEMLKLEQPSSGFRDDVLAGIDAFLSDLDSCIKVLVSRKHIFLPETFMSELATIYRDSAVTSEVLGDKLLRTMYFEPLSHKMPDDISFGRCKVELKK